MTIQGLNAYLIQHPWLILYLILHFLVDFHFQTPMTAAKKERSFQFVSYHLLIVSIGYGAILLVAPAQWVNVLLLIAAHCFIDGAKFLVTSRQPHPLLFANQRLLLFIVDQLLHIFSIGWIEKSLAQLAGMAMSSQILLLFLFGVLITKPVNILFKLAFSHFQSTDLQEEETVKGAGAMVGNLERIAMGLLMLMGQFASVGLVFTAKSIARYNKISDSPSFAEYYLIGSLYSIIAVLICYWLLFY